MAELRRADTPLAKWLANAMARWVNPETQMPGISQRKLADETGISQTQLHEILKKGHSPGPDNVADHGQRPPRRLLDIVFLHLDVAVIDDPEEIGEDKVGTVLGPAPAVGTNRMVE